jgi:hypothetical protein
LAALPALLLAGCGKEGADFTVEVKRPAAAVFAPLSAVDISEARLVFPGIAVNRSRPNDSEILYTVPGTDSSDATVRLRLEPVRDGEATVIHATVDVPPMRAKIDGVDKQLSEAKVESLLKRILQSAARNLEMGSSGAADSRQLSALLLGLAIGTNKQFLDDAMTFKNQPEKLGEALAAFDGGIPLDGDPAAVGLDPEIDAPGMAVGEEGLAAPQEAMTADDWGEGTARN